MSNGMPWLKMPSNKYQQSRVALCSRDARLDYYELYQLAAQCNTDGLFFEDGHQLTHDEIAFKLRRTSKELKLTLKELEDRKLIHVNGKGPQIVDFKVEQLKWNELKEQRRERDKRYREKRRDTDATPTQPAKSLDASPTLLEGEEDLKTRVLLLLSKSAREKLSTKPQWLDEAIQITSTKHLDDPAKYGAGILRNWLTEGRKETQQRKPSMKKKATSKQVQPKLEGDALKAAREKAAKELLK